MNRSADYLETLVRELCELPTETECVEFKVNTYKPDDIGEYVSALANSAALADQSHAYVVWGISDRDHAVVGTSFRPRTKKVGNEALESWLLQLLGPFNSKKVTPKKILEPHRIRTIERMRTQTTVLCVEDETIITYSTRPKCEGLEVIGRNQTTAKAQGVRLHATLALSAEGLPLGLLRCAYAPEKGPHKPATQRWVDGFNDTVEAASHLSGRTRVISVMDREGDMFAVFEAWRSQRRTHVLVRAKVDRILAGKQKLFASMRGGAPDGFVEVPIARLSRREKSGRLLHERRGGRMARMAVRYRQLALRPTDGFTGEAVRVSGIHLREEAPPEAEKPIEWYLLTTVEVTTLGEALKMVDYYAQRWRIEDAFRVLKSGCKVEELSMQKASSLHCAITIYAVMAWRLLLMTLLRREVPEAEAQILFTDTELRAL